MAKFNIVGYVIDDCDWCNSEDVALSYYARTKEWLCDYCTKQRKLELPAKRQSEREDKEKNRFDELTQL